MKQFLILLAIVIVCSFSSKAQYVTIPDPTFRAELIDKYPTCFNASQQMDTTCSAIVNEIMLSIGNDAATGNWDGLQYFDNLQKLYFLNMYNSLPAIFPATLKFLYIQPLGGNITNLPALPNGLTSLTCSYTMITTLPVLPTSLQYLDCSNNSLLQSLPALPGTLLHLDCYWDFQLASLPTLPASLKLLNTSRNSLITSLPSLPSSLDTLDCTSNALTILPALPSSLKRLICPNNMLTGLPAIPAQMDYISAGGNQISNLPTISGTALKTLLVAANNLSAIPTLPTGLLELNVANNQLTSLPSIPASLLNINYDNNAIPVFPALPPTLRSLSCVNNQVSTIPVLPDSLRYFECRQNQLTSLPTLPHYLKTLDCAYNQLNSLPAFPLDSMMMINCIANNITCLPVLPNGLFDASMMLYIYFDDQVNCLANLPINDCSIQVFHPGSGTYSWYDQIHTPYPLCSAVNNVNQCAAFPLMTGYVYYDNNNNSTHDVNEPYRANVKVQLSNGAYTFTNSNGYYQVSADGTGNYSTTTANIPIYFAAVPSQYNFNFISYDTLVANDFALQATATVDSLHISINPLNTAARPGFNYPVFIAYENDGTTTLSSNIVFDYDNTRLIYDSSSNASVINTGNSLTLSEPGFVAGAQKGFIGYFTVNPTAVIGDSLRSGAHIVAGATAAHDSDVVAIRASYDPNDKEATPALSPAQVANGDYIYYTIRFQNTGIDTAFSIVVTDTLNSQLQSSTLEMINTSHPCKTTVKGNAVSFEFINILLPDSNVNQLKSHGYISFRIKPLNTLVVNDIVPNKAAIYFDYNSPVITNIATTTVVDPIVVPLKLLSFTVSKGMGSNANLYWQTSNEVSVQHYEMEMSTNGRTFATIGFENAKGYEYNSYTKTIAILSNAVLYFRLKMIDIDGRFTYSNVAILKNDKANNSFSFLSNPVKDALNISLQDESLRNTTATIFTAQGLKVKTILLQHDVESVNIKSLPAGTYYLVTEKGSRQFVVLK